MSGTPCARCGLLLHTGEGRVIVSFVPGDLEALILVALDLRLRERLLCALGTIDGEREKQLRMELDA